jgi:predicted aminopeptidase
MPQATELLNAQTADFQGLLAATRDLLAGPLDGPRVDAYRAARAACLDRTGPRESGLLAALAESSDPSAPAGAVAAYREVLEALVAEERRLAERAAAERDGLAQELAGLAAGRRALAGYRSPRGWADPRAVSRHV